MAYLHVGHGKLNTANPITHLTFIMPVVTIVLLSCFSGMGTKFKGLNFRAYSRRNNFEYFNIPIKSLIFCNFVSHFIKYTNIKLIKSTHLVMLEIIVYTECTLHWYLQVKNFDLSEIVYFHKMFKNLSITSLSSSLGGMYLLLFLIFTILACESKLQLSL